MQGDGTGVMEVEEEEEVMEVEEEGSSPLANGIE